MPARLALVCLSACLACGGSQPEAPASANVATAPVAPEIKDTTPIELSPMDDEQRLKLAGSFASANNKMSFDLLRVAGGNTNENFAVSAASIELALAMTAGGARGETLAQMRQAMGLADGDDPAQLGRAAMAHWTAQAAASNSRRGGAEGEEAAVTLAPVNRLYGEQSFAFEEPFLKLTEAAFGAPFERVDFIGAAEKVRGDINKWVAEQTRDKIDELLPAASLDSMTRLVLVNALYFKARWQTQFKVDKTTQAPFMVAGKSVIVPTMNATAGYLHKLDKDIEVLSLPYAGGRFRMMIVMPTGTASLEGMQKGLSARRWEQWRSMLSHEQLRLSMPRFVVKASESIELKGALGALGMTLPFERNGADFRGMANSSNPDERLYISEVYHQAVVEVDEAGTEAAAATAVVMKLRGMAPADPKRLKIDRPFLFSIYDDATGAILFLGRVADPRGG